MVLSADYMEEKCYGSTVGSNPARQGSIPCSSANKETLKKYATFTIFLCIVRELKEAPLMSHAPAQNGFTLYHLGQDGQCTLEGSERGP